MTKRFQNAKSVAAFSALIVAAVSLIFFGGTARSFKEGLNLFYACVLPTLFPYLFITAAISENPTAGKLFYKLSPISEKLFKVNGSGLYAFFLSLISGYPIGAKTVADLYKSGALTDAEGTRAAALCSTASPVFIIVSVGKVMFNSLNFGLLLYFTHVLSAVTVGNFFSLYKRKEAPSKTDFIATKKSANFLYECAEKSVITVLIVGGLIAIFYLVTDVAAIALSPVVSGLTSAFGENMGKGVFFAVFECTKGLKYVSGGGINFLTLPVCAAACGFGGLSVMVQSLAFLKTAKIKTATFVFAKLLTSAVNFVLGLVFSLIFIF